MSLQLPIALTSPPPLLEPIILGTHSFECGTYIAGDDTCGAANQRLVTAGVLIVPEPASLAILGAGLAILGPRLRRRAA